VSGRLTLLFEVSPRGTSWSLTRGGIRRAARRLRRRHTRDIRRGHRDREFPERLAEIGEDRT